MLRIGKGTEIRSMSTLPSGLKGDDALIFDALFTGGAAGTGIAGNMSGSYRAKLMFLASYASDYFPPSP